MEPESDMTGTLRGYQGSLEQSPAFVETEKSLSRIVSDREECMDDQIEGSLVPIKSYGRDFSY